MPQAAATPPDDGLVQTFERRKMKRNFAVKRLLVVRIASPTRHGSLPRVSSKDDAVGDVIPITPGSAEGHGERGPSSHEPSPRRPSRCFGASWRTPAIPAADLTVGRILILCTVTCAPAEKPIKRRPQESEWTWFVRILEPDSTRRTRPSLRG